VKADMRKITFEKQLQIALQCKAITLPQK